MRPGQSCPGVAFRRVEPYGGCPCFNEAGAIMPRSGDALRYLCHTGPPRFNEAGAIMPRSGEKCARRRELEVLGSFNEAGAIMPRSGGIGALYAPSRSDALQ